MEFDKNPSTIRDLQRELYAWETYNFGVQEIYPKILGICEEAGELCHSVLKMGQKIRGDRGKHMADLRDAIGDVAIYALNAASARRIEIRSLPQGTLPKGTMHQDALEVFSAASKFADMALMEMDKKQCASLEQLNDLFANLFAKLATMALHLERDALEDVVRDTYRHVTRRNWRDNPETGVA